MESASPPLDFRTVYEANFKFVWRSLRRLGVHDGDVMDVTQNVFVVAYRKLPEFAGRSKVTTWLFAICQRLASDYRRSARVRREVSVDAAAFARGPGPEPGTCPFERSQRLAQAEAILDQLPDEQRTAFVLFELEGLAGEAIAELLDVPVGTVRSRLRLAREAFRREVQRLEAQSRREEAAS